jgi:nucleoside phosphorylase
VNELPLERAPLSVRELDLIKIETETRRLVCALVESAWEGAGDDRGARRIELATRVARQYGREVRLALHTLRLEAGELFNDHDQLASLILFLAHRLSHVLAPTGARSRQNLFTMIMDAWRDANEHNAVSYVPQIGLGPVAVTQKPEIGILTVLEHEFQSVLRRLDRINRMSDDSGYGFAILDRAKPEDELKNHVRDGGGAREIGWADGIVGAHRVLVVCSGKAGSDRANAAIREVEKLPGNVIPRLGWIVVGVCAGTDSRWPIGSVLVSHGMIIGVRRPKARAYEALKPVVPMEIALKNGRTAMQRVYRRTPSGLVPDVRVASADKILLRKVKFACSDHVVNEAADRAELHAFLRRKKLVAEDEHVAIEMEGVGAAFSTQKRTAIVKGVCDYADDAKGAWPEGPKMLLQLYAAETAADVAIEIVRASLAGITPPPKGKKRT